MQFTQVNEVSVLEKQLEILIDAENPKWSGGQAFGFKVEDEFGNFIARCNGVVMFGAIYTDQLWVHAQHRNRGVGKKLMDGVHKLGLEKGCFMATVNTMNFQSALSFYKKLGYEIDFERAGYMHAATCCFLRKVL
jgi:ribosomal protein S18 acetylase RimI-like enzyme